MSFELKELSEMKFQLSGYIVDAKRGVISKGEQQFSLEPKVMQVLLYLTAHAGNVVEQEELFSAVWPKSLFSANSLRRCIATLRKVFADDDRTLISTHPKIGYSLNSTPERLVNKSNKHSSIASKKRALFAGVILFTFVSLLLFLLLFFNSKEEGKTRLHVKAMQPVTATEVLEDYLAISPNGKYLAFTRNSEKNEQHIWLKHLESEKEYSLDISVDKLRSLTWLSDNSALYYVQQVEMGWQIHQLNLSPSLAVINQNILFENKQSPWISSLVSSEGEYLYFIAKIKRKFHVYQYHIESQQLHSLLTSSTDFKPYDLALAQSGELLALSGQNQQGSAVIMQLSLTKERLGDSVKASDLAVKQRFSIQWLSQHNGYLLNSGQQLYFYSNQGNLTALDFEHNHFIRFAKARPNSNDIYLISSQLDTDLKLLNTASAIVQHDINSNGMDYFPAFSPKGDKVAYFSTRYGKPELFLTDVQSQQDHKAFNNPDNFLNVDRAVWHSQGERLVFSVGQQMHLLTIDKGKVSVSAIKGGEGVAVAWYQNADDILVRRQVGSANTLYKVNITTKTEEVITQYTSGRVFVDKSDSVFLLEKNAVYVLSADKTWQLLERFEQKIVHTLFYDDGIYLLFANDKKQWFQWTKENGLTALDFTLEEKQRLAAISADKSQLLLSEESRQKDIIKLTLE